MSRPSFLGDFDVVAGPPAPIRRIAPAMPAPAPDRQPSVPVRDDRGPADGNGEPAP